MTEDILKEFDEKFNYCCGCEMIHPSGGHEAGSYSLEDVRDFLELKIKSYASQKLDEVKQEIENDLILLDINHGQSRMKGGWVSFESTIDILEQKQKELLND
jgi:hypothetical protein